MPGNERQVSDDLLKTYLDSYQQTPWAALRYLVAEANYGGRVTDELDRRVLNSYLNNFYTEEALSVANFPLSPLPEYHIPQTNTLQGFKVSPCLSALWTAASSFDFRALGACFRSFLWPLGAREGRSSIIPVGSEYDCLASTKLPHACTAFAKEAVSQTETLRS